MGLSFNRDWSKGCRALSNQVSRMKIRRLKGRGVMAAGGDKSFTVVLILAVLAAI